MTSQPASNSFFALWPEVFGPSQVTRCVTLGVALFVLFQAVFQEPYVIMFGSRSNLYTTTLVSFLWLMAWVSEPLPGVRSSLDEVFRRADTWLTILLFAFLGASCLNSMDGAEPIYRGLAIGLSAASGYWTGTLLLRHEPTRLGFLWLCLWSILGFAGYCQYVLVTTGAVKLLTDNLHASSTMLMLLAVGPLHLALHRRGWRRWLAVLAILAAFVASVQGGSRAGAMIPGVVAVLAMFLARVKKRHVFIFLAASLAGVAVLMIVRPDKRIKLEGYESIYYRAESYPLTWRLMQERPLTGVGPRADKYPYIQNYEITYPYVEDQDYHATLERIVTFDNQYLTFLAELGIPFAVLYFGGVGWLLIRLIRGLTLERSRGEPDAFAPGRLALTCALATALIHFLVFDGLYHPQISWLFHMLLALIPLSSPGVKTTAAHDS